MNRVADVLVEVYRAFRMAGMAPPTKLWLAHAEGACLAYELQGVTLHPLKKQPDPPVTLFGMEVWWPTARDLEL